MSDIDNDAIDTTAQSPEPLQVPEPPPSSDVSSRIIRTHSVQPIQNSGTTICTDSVTVKTESSDKK